MYHKELHTQELSVEKDKIEKDKGTYKYVANNLHVHLHNAYIFMCTYVHTYVYSI